MINWLVEKDPILWTRYSRLKLQVCNYVGKSRSFVAFSRYDINQLTLKKYEYLWIWIANMVETVAKDASADHSSAPSPVLDSLVNPVTVPVQSLCVRLLPDGCPTSWFSVCQICDFTRGIFRIFAFPQNPIVHDSALPGNHNFFNYESLSTVYI